jgi:glycosyltransferase involved in cell wall biosynthesis
LAERLSAYVITLNEEANIAACLESITWADDIVVIDSNSTDRTVEIARRYTERIYQEGFAGFGRLRNAALARCRYDWVLSVDADERVTPELREEIVRELAAPRHAAYFVPRKSHFLGHWIRHCGWYPDYRQPQLFDRRRFGYRDQLVHEGFECQGSVGRLEGHVLQYPFRTVGQFLQKMDRYSALRAAEMARQGRGFSPVRLILSPPFTFLRMYLLRQGFRDGLPGFVLSSLYAYYTLLKYVRLWEAQASGANGSRATGPGTQDSEAR